MMPMLAEGDDGVRWGLLVLLLAAATKAIGPEHWGKHAHGSQT